MRYKAIHLIDNQDSCWRSHFEASRFSCKPPLSLNDDGADHFTKSVVPHHYSLSHGAGIPFAAEIHNAQIVTEQLLVFDAEHFYLDSYHDTELTKTILPVHPWVGALADNSVEADFSMLDRAKSDWPAILIGSPHGANYHHWMLETLPRCWLFDEYPGLLSIPIILPPLTKPFQYETLAKVFGKSTERVRSLQYSEQRYLGVNRLIFPSYLAPRGHSSRQLEWLRSRFLTREGQPNRLIYVSRNDAINQRRLINEPEVISFLSMLGFEVVTLSGLTHAEQVDLFTDAQVIVGVSGAGITNHIFSPPGAHIIEIHPSTYTNRAYFFTTNILEQSYQFVIGVSNGGGDLHVSLDALNKALRRVL